MPKCSVCSKESDTTMTLSAGGHKTPPMCGGCFGAAAAAVKEGKKMVKGRQMRIDGETEPAGKSLVGKGDLDKMAKALRTAKQKVIEAHDLALDLVSGGAEAPVTLEKVAQILTEADAKLLDAQDRLRTAEA